MKLAISGTYSSGKTRSTMALAYYTGIPRTLARTIREIMPEAFPGKRLADVTPPEFLQIMMRRHVGRAVAEAQYTDFISDGSSLQEWLYGAARVMHGMNPTATDGLDPSARVTDPQMRFFEQVVAQFGQAFKQHVKNTYDVFIHLQHELPIANDGHRPMNEQFRTTIDAMLLATLDELEIPHHIVSGGFDDRIQAIVSLLDVPTVRELPAAIAMANEEYAQLDMRLETQRVWPARA